MIKVILVGPAGSGKTTLLNLLKSKGAKVCLSWLTRPPRENEVDGVDAHFTTVEDFQKRIDYNFFAQWKQHTPGKYYGTAAIDLDECDVFIVTPDGLKDFPQDFIDRCVTIYLNPPKDALIERMANRNDDLSKSTERTSFDEFMFSGFTRWDLQLKDWDLSRTILFDKVMNFVLSTCSLSLNTVVSDKNSTFEAEGLDSIDIQELMVCLEKNFNVSLKLNKPIYSFKELVNEVVDRMPTPTK